MVRVESVAPGSIGAELGLVPGTELVSVDGRALHDFLDWEFLSAEDQFLLLARLPTGEEIEFDIERPEGMGMGLELEPPRIRRCGNRCDFCFVDGLPDGLRPTLYVRDDDYRLSFRHGNFATLTNLKASDVARIIEYRLSPLYVSVHATDPVVRRRLLRNPRAPDVREQLRRFADHGIACHTQIVLQPGVNDGDVLDRSLSDLWALGDAVLTVSVVPVGLTEFSKHQRVREPTPDECRRAVSRVVVHAERALPIRGHSWAYGSDELYLKAGLELPPASVYGSFDQVENGVGAVRYLQQCIRDARDRMSRLDGKRVGIVTGTAMSKLMPLIVRDLEATTGGAFSVLPVKNDLFGPTVTTAGLLPGQTIRSALQARTELDLALIPGEAINDEGLFVDDLSFESLTTDVDLEVRPSLDFADALAPGTRS